MAAVSEQMIVASRRRRRHRYGYRWLKVVGLLLAGYVLLSFGQQYFKEQELHNQLAVLEDQKRILAVKNHELREQIKLLQTDAYVEKIAREELGLVRAGEVVIIRARPGEVKPLERDNSEHEIRD